MIVRSLYALEDGKKADRYVQRSADLTPKQTLYWTGSDTDIVAVNSGNGIVLAKAVGNAIITAHAMDGSGVTGTCVVSVGRKLVVISRDSDYVIDGFDLETNYNKLKTEDGEYHTLNSISEMVDNSD